MNNPFDLLLNFLSRFDQGTIFLPAGTHVHKIHTKGRPVSLWFAEATSGNLPVCQGSVNMYGYTLDADGFIIYAEVGSDTIELNWQATLQ